MYTKKDGVVYQNEKDRLHEEIIGWEYDPRTSDGRPVHEHLMESKLWGEIHRAAKTNPLLQDALDRVKIIYVLSKKI